MPFYAEQTYNTKLALRMGYASSLNKFTISEEKLTASINKVKHIIIYFSSMF